MIFIWIIARFGYSERTSFLTSVTVAQISEFSFIFATMGLSMGLIDRSILSLIGIVGILTIAVSAYMILYNSDLYALVRRTGVLRVFRAAEAGKEEAEPTSLHDHVIVVGMNDLGRRVARLLHDRGKTVIAIDTDPRKLSGLDCRTLVGDVDYASTLDDAGLPHARLAISALKIEAVNKLFVYRCRTAGVPVAAYAADHAIREQLREIGASILVESRTEAGRRFLAELDRLGGNVL